MPGAVALHERLLDLEAQMERDSPADNPGELAEVDSPLMGGGRAKDERT